MNDLFLILLYIKTIPGALYNIIKVPPEKTDAKDTLQGAKVLCSIVPENKSHPSYYHSFGKPALLNNTVPFISDVCIFHANTI